MNSKNIELINEELLKLRAENQKLKDELSNETKKHKQWKEIAMCFHDSLWKLIDEYVMTDIP